MATKGVEILNVTKISLPPLPETPPPMKLSFFDAIWISLNPIQRLMLFPNPDTNLSFPSLLQFLKSSLSATLPDYLPLAGKLTYAPSTGDVEIDFSHLNVTFLEAESDLDLHRLATSDIHDVDSFKKLVPPLDVAVLPFHVFAVQVTRFDCGGIAIGYSVHHSVVDGKALMQFVPAWSATCRAMMMNMRPVDQIRMPPLYDRSVIKHPKGEEIARQYLRTLAPALPNTISSDLESKLEEGLHPMRRTFTLDAPSIQLLKQRATRRHEPSSAFSAITAHVWACIVRAKSFDPKEHVFFIFLMDCRSRLDPPVDDRYFGPCVRPAAARATVGELLAHDGLARASEAIRSSTSNVAKDPLRDCESWIDDIVVAMPFERVVNVTASPKFRAYDADFGWGRPDRFESVSMNKDAEFALVAGREEGTVQVSVSLDADQMDTFAELFRSGLIDSESCPVRV